MKRSFPYLLISIVAIACYWNSLSCGFSFDDFIVVTSNRLIRSTSTLPQIFATNYFHDNFDDGTYRPLTTLTFAFNYALGELNPFGYHLFNLLLNLINSLLVFILVRSYTNGRIALFTALLFSAHPVHIEAVTNIANRTEPVAALLILCAWLAYRYRERDARYYRLALLLYFLALLSKESAITFVGMLVLADVCERFGDLRAQWRNLLKGHAGFVAVVALYLGMRLLIFGKLGIPEGAMFFRDVGFLPRLYTMSQAFIKYFQLMIWPDHLVADYDFSQIPLVTSFTPAVAISLLVIITIFAVGLLMLRWHRLLAFSILCFFVTMSIVSNVVLPTGIFIAERVLYLPVVSVCLMAGAALNYIYERASWGRWLSAGLALMILTAMCVRDYRRNLDWRTNDAIVYSLFVAAPNNLKALMGMAQIYERDGRISEAEALFKRAVQLGSDKAITHGRLGDFYVRQACYIDGITALERSPALSLRYGFVYTALARAWTEMGEFARAADALRGAVAISPPDPLLHQSLGTTLLQLGDNSGALLEFERALELKPDMAEAYNNLGIIYVRMNREAEARRAFETAIQLRPGYQSAIMNLEQLNKK